MVVAAVADSSEHCEHPTDIMKRLLLIAILVSGIVVAAGWWYHRHRLLATRRAAVAESAEVEAALQEHVDTADFAGDDRRWGEVLDILKSRCDVPLVVHEAETAAMGVDRQTLVVVPSGVFPLDELLDEVTGRMDIAWRRSGGDIEITAFSIADASRKELFTRVYPLPAGSALGEKVTDEVRALCELIKFYIAPWSWDEVGSTGVIEPAGGVLVVRQTDEIHRRIREFLSQMESLPNRRSRQLAGDRSAADEWERIENVLAKMDSVHFHDEPLNEALNAMANRHGLRIYFSVDALANAAANPAIPVSLSLSNVSVRTILRELLAARQLTYVIRNGSIVVTSPAEAKSRLPHVIYDVGDLVEASGGVDFDHLIDLVTTVVDPDSWGEVGGPGNLSEMGDRCLVVSQTQENHQILGRLLLCLQAHLAPGVDPASDQFLEPTDDVADAVEQALDREVTLKYAGLSLGNVCSDLSLRLSIPVLPRMRADSTVTLDALVSIDLPPLPLRDALALLLQEHQLTFDPRGEVLYVTTPVDAERDLAPRIIDVRHLLDPAGGGLEEDTLIELITKCVEPDKWDETGGPGTLQIFRGLLVFSQTYEVSRQVQELIDVLSEHCLPSLADASTASAAAAPRQPVWIDATFRVEAIVAALGSRETMHLEPPIGPAIRTLCDKHGIPCVFDQRWVADARIDVPWPGYVFDAVDQPLDVIFSKLAESKEGGIVVSHGVLLVTDEVSAASHGLLRLYPTDRVQVDGIAMTAAQIADMLAEQLEPDTWRTNGGYGAIEPVNDDWLLVVQTLPMHRKVEDALAKLSRGETLRLPMP